jgi:hypothetical protein
MAKYKQRIKIGNKYNRLTVLAKAEPKVFTNYTTAAWVCKCECYNFARVVGSYLNNGSVKSCGCAIQEAGRNRAGKRRTGLQVQEGALATLKHVYGHHTGNCKKNDRVPLDFDIYCKIAKQPCTYCGKIDVKNVHTSEGKNASKERYLECFVSINGIDRIDSTKGYELDNCTPCCKVCNVRKMDLTQLELAQWVISTYGWATSILKGM